MSRMNVATRIISLSIMLPLAACAATSGPVATSGGDMGPSTALSERPNVLFIAIDDLRPDLGVYGHPVAYTPNIDRLAETSLVFDNAFVSQAVCGPSRAALMTGLRPDTTGITTLKEPVSETAPNAVTLSQTFKNAGYESIGIGKIYHHADDDMEGWTKRPDDAIYEDRKAERRAGVPRLSHRARPFEEMPDTINVREAQVELERLGENQNPFFMAVGIHRPHLPFNYTQADWDLYDGKAIPGPINPEGQIDAPSYALVSYEIWNYDDTEAYQQSKVMPKNKADELRRAYLASVTYADRLVGDLLSTLDAQGLTDNTIVVLWSDHGWKIADHAAWAKHSTANIDIRIPMMIRTPGMAAKGQRSDAFVETVDLYPTLAELTGLGTPTNLEGLSFAPLLENPDRIWKNAAFTQFPRNIPGKGRGTGYTVRTDDYRYTAWVIDGTDQIVAEELYDLRNDGDETRNVARDAAYRSVLDQARRAYRGGWKSVRDQVANRPRP